ncbi:MAG: ABC transporter permease [Thermoplasmata archaeon]|nr:MAG: ABC transporter permease [Thermoplasmata archaeon]
MNVRRVTSITLRVFRGFKHDKRSIALMVIAPLVAMSVFGIAFGGEVTNIDVVIVNEDEGAMVGFPPDQTEVRAADMFIDHLDEEVLIIKFMSSMDEAVQKVKDGEAWAVIHFPANYSEALLTGESTTVTIRADKSNTQIFTTIMLEMRNAMDGLMDEVGHRPPVEFDDSQAVYGQGAEFSDFLIPGVIAFAIFLLTTLLTLLAFTTERVNKTLDRVLVTPVTEAEIVAGYAVAFGLIGTGQAVLLISWGIVGFDIFVEGNLALAILVAALLAIASMAFGILLSAAARTEAQATQMIPLIVLPVFLLSGIFWPIEAVPAWLQPVAYILPPTHAVEALRSIMVRGWGLGEIWPQVAALLVFIAVYLMLATLSLRRKG